MQLLSQNFETSSPFSVADRGPPPAEAGSGTGSEVSCAQKAMGEGGHIPYYSCHTSESLHHDSLNFASQWKSLVEI